MGYWEQADRPFYYSMASVFPIADRYFCSVLGQTYPNRRYLLAATSIGQVDDTTPALTDYPPNGTIFDLLDANGITWKDYYTDLATPSCSRRCTSRTSARRSSRSPGSSPTRRPAPCPASAWSSPRTRRSRRRIRRTSRWARRSPPR
jgi:phospholipase C